MTAGNFSKFLAFVWPEDGGYDSPKQGYHVTKGDPGGGTFGGVTEQAWWVATERDLVTGELSAATRADLSAILEVDAWGTVCDDLPSGLDVLVANGVMMTGQFVHIFQSCLGFIGADVDGIFGPDTLGVAHSRDTVTLINAVHGAHYRYLTGLGAEWTEFGRGWTARLVGAHALALSMVVLPLGTST